MKQMGWATKYAVYYKDTKGFRKYLKFYSNKNTANNWIKDNQSNYQEKLEVCEQQSFNARIKL